MLETDGLSPKTDDAYAKRGQQQLKRARAKYPDAEDAVDAFSRLYAEPDLRLRSSSTRSYKAAVIHTLKREVDEGRLEQQRALAGVEVISRLLIERRGRPEPRTSRLKYLEITEEEYTLISGHLRQRVEKTDTLEMVLRLLLEIDARVGARLSELLHARLRSYFGEAYAGGFGTIMASVKTTILGSASHQALLPFKLIGLRAGGGRVLPILTMSVGVVHEEIPN